MPIRYVCVLVRCLPQEAWRHFDRISRAKKLDQRPMQSPCSRRLHTVPRISNLVPGTWYIYIWMYLRSLSCMNHRGQRTVRRMHVDIHLPGDIIRFACFESLELIRHHCQASSQASSPGGPTGRIRQWPSLPLCQATLGIFFVLRRAFCRCRCPSLAQPASQARKLLDVLKR